MSAILFSFLHVSVMIHTTTSFVYMPKEDKPLPLAGNTVSHKNIARIHDFPHHVLIVYESYFCSGSLIRSLIVVTTASCFERSSRRKTVVKVGASRVTGPGQVIPVVEIKIHEYYKHTSEVNNDVALLALQEHVKFSSDAQKVLLVAPEVALRVGTTIDVSGWGHTNLPQKFMNHLLWSEMVVIDNTECKSYYYGLITTSSFCAKYQFERRLSDNGGPAVYKNVLVGLLSFGGTNREEPYVAVFTNTSYFHRWIELNSRRLLEKYCVGNEFDSY